MRKSKSVPKNKKIATNKNLIIRVNGLDMTRAFLNKGLAFRIKLNRLTERKSQLMAQ